MWIVFAAASTVCWALINVLDSVLVHNFHRNPMVLMWSQSLLSMTLLIVTGPFLAGPSPWIVWLFIFGMVGYLADLWFLHVLGQLDVSIANAAWAVLALFLSITGFVFFHDSWTTTQTLGSVLILTGTFMVSFWHRQAVNLRTSLWLLLTLGVAYLPFYVMKKVAIDTGDPPLTVFYWMVFGRESLSFTVPLLFREIREPAIAAIRGSWLFSLVNAVVIASFFLAEYFGALAYVTGTLSLVAMTSNLQPFVVMGMAWTCIRLWPEKAPKELMSRQSVVVKAASFLIVFVGLALLSVPQ